MRLFTLAAVSAALLISLAACSAAPGTTLAPGVTQPPGGVPTQAPGVPTQAPVVPSELCAGQPTYSPDAPAPSFAQDDTLNSRFPAQIDGEPVTNILSSFWVQSMCFYGESAEDLGRFAAIWPVGTAPQISSANGQVELDGDIVHIQAFRVPGADPNAIFSHLPEFTAALGGDPADAANAVVTTTNLGGKNVYMVTDSDGDESYHYVSGDTVWSVDVDEATAAKVFAAIQ